MPYKSYNDDYIKLASTIPGFKEKLHIDIKSPTDKVYWYIKFNILLDGESVSRNTMNVTDTLGYIIETEIGYNKDKNLIVINPLENYIQNEYYILTITTQVRSARKQNLKNDIHILFKLKDNIISEFKILPPNVKVPEPKKRPPENATSRVYSFDKYISTNDGRKDWLPMANVMINPILGAIGLFLTIVSLFLGQQIIIIICSAIAVLGVFHIIIQLIKSTFRSNFYYNRGVKCFNREKYTKSKRFFIKALEINPNNEYAEYAIGKISYYNN